MFLSLTLNTFLPAGIYIYVEDFLRIIFLTHSLIYQFIPERHSELCRTSDMELFEKIVNG